jgi:hypothetical protein
MSQYRTGSVSLQNGSTVVVGVGTAWAAALRAGYVFTRRRSGVPYVIASVNSDTTLTLSAAYQGADEVGADYLVVRDFTPIFGVPLIQDGDLDTAALFRAAVLRLEQAIVEQDAGLSVAEAILSVPPSAPAPRAVYLVGAAPTGAWAGQADHLAVWDGGAWGFVAPQPGWRINVRAAGSADYIFSAGGWSPGPVGAAVLAAAASAAAAAASAGTASAVSVAVSALVLDKVLATAADVVAVVIYDTRNDSDGGAWTRKCCNASWWAEVRNTETRGSKRDFPVVAGIVVQRYVLTIYNLLDLEASGLPKMWMKFVPTGWKWGAATIGCFALNARLICALSGGIETLDFANDTWVSTSTTGTYSRGNIGGRTTAASGYMGRIRSTALPSTDCRAVHARVLPGAPLDAAGLPIPTIAVAHGAGASVIHPSGKAANITPNPAIQVEILPSSRLAVSLGASTVMRVGGIPYADVASAAWATMTYTPTSIPALPGAYDRNATAFAGGYIAIGNQSGGLSYLAEDTGYPANGMVAYTTTSYATGWLPGDIRGAWICDGTTGSITGSVIPDRSCKANGLTINGTLTGTAVATGADLVGISGFSSSSYLEQAYSSNLDFGLGDVWIGFWEANGNAGGDFFDRYSGSGARIRALISGGKLIFYASDGSASTSVTSTTDVASATSSGIWRRIDLVVRSRVMEVWVNRVLEATASASSVGSLSAFAPITIGNRYDHANALSGGAISLFRVSAYAPSPEQIRNMYDSEKALFCVASMAFIAGSSSAVSDLSYDDSRNLLAVGTGDGVTLYSGFRVVGYLSPPLQMLTSGTINAVSASAGFVLLGSSAEAGVYNAGETLLDETERVQGVPSTPALAWQGVTTDATPTIIGRRGVAEGETIAVEAVITAVEYGDSPLESAHYRVKGAYRRNYNGNVALLGALCNEIIHETTSTMDGTLTVDTTAQTVAVVVTGKSATRIVWRVEMTISN